MKYVDEFRNADLARGLARAIAQAPALPNEFTYAPYRRRHLELQRQMGPAVDALRQRVRDALACASPAL